MSSRKLWGFGATIIVLVVVAPNLSMLGHLFLPATDAWDYIQDNLLLGYITSSATLVGFTALTSGVLASALAWFITAYDFPGRKLLSIALIFPIAIPPYIGAYTYSGLLGYTGAVQRFCRETIGWNPPPTFGDIMNMPGAVFIFTIFLYPYLYLILRGFLDRQASQLVDASRLLGAGRIRTYWRVILPLTRNSLIAGLTLISFEVLSDYGVVSYFGIDTFTTAIFKAWTDFGDIQSALRLSAILLVAVITITSLEKASRGARGTAYASTRVTPLTRIRPRGAHLALVTATTWGTLVIALIIPLIQLAYWGYVSVGNIRWANLGEMFANTLILGLVGAALTVVGAVIIGNYQRIFPGVLSRLYSRIAILGYSVPSAVIAITLLLFFITFDKYVGVSLSLSVTAIVIAYFIRFLAVGMQNVESGFSRIGTKYAESSRLLGRGVWQTFWRVDLPMMRLPLQGAFLLVFIDIIKELPIVLILRPFNYYTLSTKVFEYAHDEMIPESAPASLLIIALAAIPALIYYGRARREADA